MLVLSMPLIGFLVDRSSAVRAELKGFVTRLVGDTLFDAGAFAISALSISGILIATAPPMDTLRSIHVSSCIFVSGVGDLAGFMIEGVLEEVSETRLVAVG